MKADAENLFVGATIVKDGENYLVVKVNAKSFYAAKGVTMDDYNFMLNKKLKGVTFKQFCTSNNILMYHYSDNFEIADSEAAKKEVVQATQSTAGKTDSIIDRAEKMVLTELINKKKLRPLQNITVGNKIMRVIENRDNDRLLLNLDSDYVLYNRSLDAAYKVCSVYDWGKTVSTVPWEKITPQ